MNRVEVRKDQLGDILAQVERDVPVTIIADTEVRMNKTINGDRSQLNPYNGKVRKIQKSNVFVAMDYETAVNKRLIKEGKDDNFVAEARKWGDRVGESPILSKELKNGTMTYYLQTYFVTKNKPEVQYEFLNEDGTRRPIEKEEFEQYMPVKSSGGDRQGLNNELIVRTFKLSNLREVRANGNCYVITD